MEYEILLVYWRREVRFGWHILWPGGNTECTLQQRSPALKSDFLLFFPLFNGLLFGVVYTWNAPWGSQVGQGGALEVVATSSPRYFFCREA